MKLSDDRIVYVLEFSSREGDAGRAVGAVMYRNEDSEYYTVHSFYHNGADDPNLTMFWGHYECDWERALEVFADKASRFEGYELYRSQADTLDRYCAQAKSKDGRSLIALASEYYPPETLRMMLLRLLPEQLSIRVRIRTWSSRGLMALLISLIGYQEAYRIAHQTMPERRRPNA